ncbi:MAG: phosphatase PAP2 family protein [Anaerolineaceae bacterium]|jgi:undecaprenyl-diphosphatase
MNWKSLAAADARLTERLRLQQGQSVLWRTATILAHSGDSWFWTIGLFIIWLLTRGDWHNRAALLAGGVVGLALFVFALKFTIRRRRPEGEWGAIYRNTDPHSFPSGHAARAALLAVMALGLGPAWFAIAVVIWAPLVCLARIWTGLHYFSDILGGIALGALAGGLMLTLQPFLMNVFPFLFTA